MRCQECGGRGGFPLPEFLGFGAGAMFPCMACLGGTAHCCEGDAVCHQTGDEEAAAPGEVSRMIGEGCPHAADGE